MSKFDKYFNDFTPSNEGGGSQTPTLTVGDLQAVETRLNKYIDESIKRLDTKLDTITAKNTETKNMETNTENAPEGANNESEE